MQMHKDKYVNIFSIALTLLFLLSFSTLFISFLGVMPDVTRRVAHFALRVAQVDLVFLLIALWNYRRKNA